MLKIQPSYKPNLFPYLLTIMLLLAVNAHSFGQINNKADSSSAKKPKPFICTFIFDSAMNKFYKTLVIPRHKKMPAGPDDDGDGVINLFDLVLNTPPGAEVDNHGRAFDTDEDGIPDYKDRERLTLKSCFPVNADGVGACPEMPMIDYDNRDGKPMPLCDINDLPAIAFVGESAHLTDEATAVLDSVARQMLKNSHCEVKVVGHSGPINKEKQLSWDRVYSVVKYLVDVKGVFFPNVVFSYGNTGNPATVNFETCREPNNGIPFEPYPTYCTLIRGSTAGRSFGIREFHGELAQELMRRQTKKQPVGGLKDSDGDGITDQFDLEPYTPPGAEVDTHGRAVDTDGDGVPDYKDKEKLTQVICFPVNDSGVGTCPEPQCCKQLERPRHPPIFFSEEKCDIDSLPPIAFKKGESTLNENARTILDSVAQIMLANPHCRVIVRSYISDASTYKLQQLSWDRVYATIKYLVISKGILSTHIIFAYGQQGKPDTNAVDLIPTTEDGPHMVPAPHPMYSTLKYHEVDW